jgi:hypothetical protein
MQKSLVWVTVAEERAAACLPCENNNACGLVAMPKNGA